jgi:hypothetical protein
VCFVSSVFWCTHNMSVTICQPCTMTMYCHYTTLVSQHPMCHNTQCFVHTLWPQYTVNTSLFYTVFNVIQYPILSVNCCHTLSQHPMNVCHTTQWPFNTLWPTRLHTVTCQHTVITTLFYVMSNITLSHSTHWPHNTLSALHSLHLLYTTPQYSV